MKKSIYVVVGVVLFAIVAAAWMFNPSTPVRCVIAEKQVIQQYVDERGVTRLPDVHTITMPFAGRIGRIDLKERQAVAQGEVVAAVRPIDLATEVAAAEAAVQQLSAAIIENDDTTVENTAHLQSQKFVESMASTVAAAFARMTSGKKRVDVSQVLFNRILGLKDARTQDELDRADLQLVVSQVDYQQDVLTWQAIKAIESATQLLPKLVLEYTERKKLARAVLEQQRAEAITQLDQAKLKQQRGTMFSPVDGVVLERLVSDEQFLAAGTELLKIGDLRELEVETDLLSQDVSQLQVGNPVEIYGPAVSSNLGSGVAGRVKRIHPAGFTKLSSLGVEQQRVRVIVEFVEGEVAPLLTKSQLGVGFRVRVRIFTATSNDAVTVPRSSLFRGPNRDWQLFVVRGGRSQLQAVKVGLLNDRQAEILEGVNAGETVVSSPDNSISDGAAVSVELGVK